MFFLLIVFYVSYFLRGNKNSKNGGIIWKFIIITFSFFLLLLLALHVLFFRESEQPDQLFLEGSYLSFTVFYILIFLFLAFLANYILGNTTNYRVKIFSGNEIEKRLNNKSLYLPISKNLFVYIEPHIDTEINEFYLYYINEDKLIIYYNEKS